MCLRITNTLKVFLFALFMGFLAAAVSTADPNGGNGKTFRAPPSGVVKTTQKPPRRNNEKRIIV